MCYAKCCKRHWMPVGVIIALLCCQVASASKIGLYFDTAATSNCVVGPTEYPVIRTAYLIAHDARTPIGALEGRIEIDGQPYVNLVSIENGGVNFAQFPELRFGFTTPLPQSTNTLIATLNIVATDSCSFFLRSTSVPTVPYHDGFVVIDGDTQGDLYPLFPAYGGPSSPSMTIGELECPIESSTAIEPIVSYCMVEPNQLCLYGHWQNSGFVEFREEAGRLFCNGFLVAPRVPANGFARVEQQTELALLLEEIRELQRENRGASLSSSASDKIVEDFARESRLVEDVVDGIPGHFKLLLANGMSIQTKKHDKRMEAQELCRQRFEMTNESRGTNGVRTYAIYQKLINDGGVVVITSNADVLVPQEIAETFFFLQEVSDCMNSSVPLTSENWGRDRLFSHYVAEQLRVPLPVETVKGGVR